MIQVEIIAIGSELLSGFTINENATFISRALTADGFTVKRHTSIGDIPEMMEESLRRALRENDVVITTGGLGPTLDDITRESVAKVMKCEMRHDAAVAADLTRRYGANRKSIDDQAVVPAKAQALINPVGTAPGLVFDEDGKILIVLPGVPYEMRSLFLHQVLPLLKAKFPQLKRPYVETVNFVGIPEPDVDVVLRQLHEQYPKIQFGIYPNQGVVLARLTANSAEELKEPVRKLKAAFQENLFESESGSISEAVHGLLRKKGLTLSCAESCTGGALSAALTQYAGASDYFIGSLVTYSNSMKEEFLHVDASTLNEHGAVSEETVREMLKGLLNRLNTDFGLAVTGVAGPTGGTVEKPVGTVWCAIGVRAQEPVVWMLHLKGDRAANIQRTVNLMLGRLYQIVSDLDAP